ncbi:MAG: lipopolysaccharide biosynthesis protein [Marinovum sp.]|nr:lipopolysaccharide biosynthesis protein [Marinovum sp.]
MASIEPRSSDTPNDGTAAATSERLMHKLKHDGAGSLFVKVSSAGLSFFMFLAIARGMSTEDYALFGFGFSAATLMVIAGSLGQRLGAVRFIPVHLERGDMAGVYGFTRRGYRIVALGSATLGLAWILISNGLDQMTGGSYAVSVAIFTLVLGLAEYQAHVLRGHGKIILALAPREVIWRAAVTALFALPAFGYMDLIAVDTGFYLISGLLLGIALLQGSRHAGTRPITLWQATSSTKDRATWNASAKVFWYIALLRNSTPQMAVIIVGLLLVAEDTAAYFAAYRVSMLVGLVLVAANMLAMPMLSGAHERGDMDAVRTICRFITIFTAVPGVIFFLAFLFAGDVALWLFSPEFVSAKWALVLIATGYLIKVLCGPDNMVLQMMGQEEKYLKVSLWINAAALLGLAPLVWFFGIMGAAFATGFEIAATGLLGVYFCRTTLEIDPSVMSLIKRRAT